jgi:hypothetical protein
MKSIETWEFFFFLTHYAIYTPFNAFFTPTFVVKKVTIFSARPPTKDTSGGCCQKGMCPLLFGGFEWGGSPPHHQEFFMDL